MAAERLRILFVTTLAFLSGLVLYQGTPGLVLGMPVMVFTGLVYAVFIGLSSTLICLFLPGLIATLEAFALSRLTFVLLVQMFPGFWADIAAQPMLNATAVVIGAAVYYEALFRRLPRNSLLPI